MTINVLLLLYLDCASHWCPVGGIVFIIHFIVANETRQYKVQKESDCPQEQLLPLYSFRISSLSILSSQLDFRRCCGDRILISIALFNLLKEILWISSVSTFHVCEFLFIFYVYGQQFSFYFSPFYVSTKEYV